MLVGRPFDLFYIPKMDRWVYNSLDLLCTNCSSLDAGLAAGALNLVGYPSEQY